MARKITILGMGATAMERRIDIEKYCVGEKWSLNNAYHYYSASGIKFDRFFELHKWAYLKTWDNLAPVDHFAALHSLGCPVFVMEHIPVVHKQYLYPVADVFRHFKSNYFLGSPSLMLALALYEHDNGETIDEIRAWGIDTNDPSHAQQRHSWAYWISKAQERGITISGTGLEFMSEFENDEGLRGLREAVGDILANEATMATVADNEGEQK